MDMRGLGIVLKFTNTDDTMAPLRIIPSRAMDKMMFGILPGDQLLVWVKGLDSSEPCANPYILPL